MELPHKLINNKIKWPLPLYKRMAGKGPHKSVYRMLISDEATPLPEDFLDQEHRWDAN